MERNSIPLSNQDTAHVFPLLKLPEEIKQLLIEYHIKQREKTKMAKKEKNNCTIQ